MKLSSWLTERNLSPDTFARLIGVGSVRTVYRYLDGSRTPKRDVLTAIVVVTAGKVTANDFFDLATDRGATP